MDEPANASADQTPPLRRSMVLCVREGVVRAMGQSLVEGVFLAGFVAAMGSDAWVMGLLSAMPLAAQAFQIICAQIIAAAGSRRSVFIAAGVVEAAVWGGITLIAFFAATGVVTVWLFAGLYALYSLAGSARTLAWLDWMRELVPGRLRGRFFARRNMFVLPAGILLTVPAARFVDWYKGAHPQTPLPGYGFVFGAAAVLLIASRWIARGIGEPLPAPVEGNLLRTALRNAWQSTPFRRYFLFRLYIQFAMATSGSLLVFYLIRELGCSSTLAAGLDVMATLLGAATLMFWGWLADRVGNRPAMMLTFALKVVWSGLWIFAGADTYVLLVVIYLLSAHGPGNVLLHQNMLMKLAPQEGAAAAIGFFNAITQAVAALGPIAGGFMIHSLLPKEISLGGWSLTNWQQLILISTVLRIGGVIGLLWVHEPESWSLRRFARLERSRENG